ncbi:MAG: PIN domain-containing protein [Thermoanaerobaculales bacterium]|jgi:predicted nucleic acid-binding protein|nr:PIN domain-containing protein [Thermoanaerobaculales bacterium]
MIEPVFVDTNVLVYRFDAGRPEKQRVAEAWLTRLWDTRSGRVSFQVLREFYVTTTRKLATPLATEHARRAVRSLLAWNPAPSSGGLLETAWELEDRFSIAWWDALIVAAARDQACAILLTEDLQDGQDIAGVRVVDPFLHDPGDIIG